MIKFFMAIKDFKKAVNEIKKTEQKIKKLEMRITSTFDKELKIFEEKVQKMTFAYTNNLDDTKSEYLKKYLETRLDCLQNTLYSIPKKLESMQSKILSLESALGDEADD